MSKSGLRRGALPDGALERVVGVGELRTGELGPVLGCCSDGELAFLAEPVR